MTTKKELETKIEHLNAVIERTNREKNQFRDDSEYWHNEVIKIRDNSFRIPKIKLPEFDLFHPVSIVFGIIIGFILLFGFVTGMDKASDYDYDGGRKVYKNRCYTKPQFLLTKYNPAYHLGCFIGKPLDNL